MIRFRYQALEAAGATVQGVIEAEDRRSALQQLNRRGLVPASLEAVPAAGASPAPKPPASTEGTAPPPVSTASASKGFRFGTGVKRKEITAFTREIAALLEAAIPIPQALESLSEEEPNPALKQVVQGLSESVRKGASFSGALAEQPELFSKLYVSMVRVGEEAGALQKVMTDLAALMEHEDEIRGEVVSAVAYPAFVLGFGILTVFILLAFVLPRLFGMLQEMLSVLPLPTLILLSLSKLFSRYWWALLLASAAAAIGGHHYVRTPQGALLWDRLKLRIPVVGGVFRSAALGRFARTLGTLVKSGVSLLPALKIVENTIGNLVLAQAIAQVSEQTRGGDSLATPLRKLNIFPKSVIQMIDVGEETGRLDEMLLKVAGIEERQMRARTKTLISLLAPALILVVGALVGFMVIALLLPIFKMSQSIH